MQAGQDSSLALQAGQPVTSNNAAAHPAVEEAGSCQQYEFSTYQDQVNQETDIERHHRPEHCRGRGGGRGRLCLAQQAAGPCSRSAPHRGPFHCRILPALPTQVEGEVAGDEGRQRLVGGPRIDGNDGGRNQPAHDCRGRRRSRVGRWAPCHTRQSWPRAVHAPAWRGGRACRRQAAMAHQLPPAPVVPRLLTNWRPMTASSEVSSSSGMTAKGSCTDCRMLIHWLSASSCRVCCLGGCLGGRDGKLS